MPIYARLVGWYADRHGGFGISDARESKLQDARPELSGTYWSNKIRSFVEGAAFMSEIVDVEFIFGFRTEVRVNGVDREFDFESITWAFALIWRVPTCAGTWKLEHWCIYFGGAWVPLAKVLQTMEDSIDGIQHAA